MSMNKGQVVKHIAVQLLYTTWPTLRMYSKPTQVTLSLLKSSTLNTRMTVPYPDHGAELLKKAPANLLRRVGNLKGVFKTADLLALGRWDALHKWDKTLEQSKQNCRSLIEPNNHPMMIE
eukprot:24592-Pelagomonas_calceolata.AAC.2